MSQTPPQGYLAQDKSILSGASETTSFGWWISDSFNIESDSGSVLQAHLSGPFKEYVFPLEILSSSLEIEFGKITTLDIVFSYDPQLNPNNKPQQNIEALRELVFPRLTDRRAHFHLETTHELPEGIVLEGMLSIQGVEHKVFVLSEISQKDDTMLGLVLHFTFDRRDWDLSDFEGYLSNYITISGEIVASR